MAEGGGVEMMIDLLSSENNHVQRQACKALANLAVNSNLKKTQFLIYK